VKTKKIAWLVIIAAGVAILALVQGCGKPRQPQQAGQAPQNKDVILSTTTSTQDSGLLALLVPKFEEKTGYRVKTVAVGTGAALEMGKKGEADVLLVHAPKSEKELVDSGVGINYQLVMHNDFILVGPAGDPAGIKGTGTLDAFQKIAGKKAAFISRGDESGTHKKEKEIWAAAGIKPEGAWYQSSGSGMGQTLNIANEKQGYTLTDRATYMVQKKNLKLDILAQGDKTLLNIYHVMQVNPEKFSKVNQDGAKAFVDFMVAPETQQLIGEFDRDKYGESLFFPDAGKKEEDLGK